MAHSLLIGIVTAIVVVAIVAYLNERHGLLSSDRFPNSLFRFAAYLWFGALVLTVTTLVGASSTRTVTPAELANMSFWALFLMHVLLLFFLFGWWLLCGTPPIREFLNLQTTEPGKDTLIGIAVGVGGWAATLTVALTAALILTALDLLPADMKPSPMIPWMAALPIWQKGLIVFMAMTVEEAFFRGWLQKRVGLIASTIAFAIAHAGYGQPFMLIGVTVVSLIIGLTFYKTRKLLPCIIAHGVFDAIQLFIIVPLALRFMPQG